jgi:hypothetical protein
MASNKLEEMCKNTARASLGYYLCFSLEELSKMMKNLAVVLPEF